MKYTVFAGILSLPIIASAAADATKSYDEIVVTASRSGEKLDSIPSTVMVIDSEQIKQHITAGQSLSDVLGRLVPSMGVSSETNTHYTQMLRGRPPVILIDGVSQYDSRDLPRKFQSISADAIERIEVISGASAVYGAGGIGGVINIITKKPKDGKINFSTTVGISSSNNFKGDSIDKHLSQSISGTSGRLDYLIMGALTHRGNAYDADHNRIAQDTWQTSSNDTKSHNISGKLGIELSQGQRLEFTADTSQTTQDTEFTPDYGKLVPTVNIGGRQLYTLEGLKKKSGLKNQAVKSLELDSQPKTERNAFSVTYKNKNLSWGNLDVTLYNRDRTYRFYPRALTPIPTLPVFQSTSEAQSTGINATVDSKLSDAVGLVWGMDYSQGKNSQSAKRYNTKAFLLSGGKKFVDDHKGFRLAPDVNVNTTALFAQSKWQANDAVTVRAGARYENISQKISNHTSRYEIISKELIDGFGLPSPKLAELEGDTLEYNPFLINAGITWDINDTHQVFTNYSEGFVVPDVSRMLRDAVPEGKSNTALLARQLRRSAKGIKVSDLESDAFKTHNVELGWRADFDKFSVSATGFVTQSNKTPLFNPDFSVEVASQKRTVKGIELQGDAYINNFVTLGGSYSKMKGETELRDGSTDDLPPSQVSPDKLVAYAEFAKDIYNFRLQANHVSDYEYEIKDKTFDTNAYTTLDASVGIELPVGDLSINVQNLANKKYQTVFGQWAGDQFGPLSDIPARGRTIGVSYSVDY